MKVFTFFCVLVWCSFVGTIAMSADKEAIAKQTFIKATESFSQEKYIEAARLFRQAYQVKPSWKIQYNIAQSESAAKRYGLALQAFELFLADGGDEIGVERKDEVLQEIRRLRDMVASLGIEGPDGAEVFVDGLKRGTIPLEGVIKLAAGKRHEIKVVLNGDVMLQRTIRLSGGDETTLVAQVAVSAPEVQPAPVETAEEPMPVAPVEEEPPEIVTEPVSSMPDSDTVSGSSSAAPKTNGSLRKLRIAGAVFLGLGSVVAIGGGVMGGLSLAQSNDVKELCDNPENECNTAEGTEAYDNARGYGIAANIIIPAGLTLATTGIILLLVGKKKREQLSAFGLGPLIGQPHGGIDVLWRF